MCVVCRSMLQLAFCADRSASFLSDRWAMRVVGTSYEGDSLAVVSIVAKVASEVQNIYHEFFRWRPLVSR